MLDTSRHAVVLLSGGLDSTTVLALVAQTGTIIHALSFRYGQRHEQEIEAARRIAAHYQVAHHHIIDIDLRTFGGSALTAEIPVPKDRPVDAVVTAGADGAPHIPITYAPARNTIFLSFALALAEVTGSHDIYIGVNARDYSGYPDCRPAYIAAFENMANVATRAGVEATRDGTAPIRIRTPLIDMSKRDIIVLGTSLGVDYSVTTSCYDPAPHGEACGRCDACQLRRQGFADAGCVDPAHYRGTDMGTRTHTQGAGGGTSVT